MRLTHDLAHIAHAKTRVKRTDPLKLTVYYYARGSFFNFFFFYAFRIIYNYRYTVFLFGKRV